MECKIRLNAKYIIVSEQMDPNCNVFSIRKCNEKLICLFIVH